VSRTRQTPLQDVVAGPLAEQECVAKRTNGPADEERPMLEGLKKLQGVGVHLPRRTKDYPHRDRLSLRFERFRAAY
jgi:hypothetical protein